MLMHNKLRIAAPSPVRIERASRTREHEGARGSARAMFISGAVEEEPHVEVLSVEHRVVVVP